MFRILTFLIVGSLLFSVYADKHEKHGKHKEMMKKHFEEMDTNKDGKISQEEWNNFHQSKFKEIDKDNDGSLTKEELKNHWKENHKKHHKED